ncbi:hypothetical protein H7J87_12440 [Mycolicibacterium wolinskyi]|uniref:Uncharacterized protein n=1 Tax=Mycolicibacterium wolinskyi TaxID=59750 RepID=A0A1X2FJE6_9MYCO|nr:MULTISPECIES: hypothetical protein [Mycolicibacterium]MCV7286137.1 hypothetical protein [Mycolicibacterium wolinskyi]MCV7296333.1 hypothetical protein [Mycolicibacterium goodii]ORX18554.1 hypothetical protein AWC31_14760 [Mycolicibacterium wolinskyi]
MGTAAAQWTGGPPPNKPDKTKWILGGVALVAIIALAIVGTMHFTRPDAGASNADAPGNNTHTEFASADDTGPAGIITDDSTCEAWRTISHDMEAVSDAVKWNEQDYSVPATQWNPDQRAAFEKKRTALTAAMPNVADLAKQTPHRVMRELYGQYIAYSQAWIDAMPTYSPPDNYTVAASNVFYTALNRVCDAIYFRGAQQTAPLIATASPPSDAQAPSSDSASRPGRFLSDNHGTCGDWMALVTRFDHDPRADAWADLDPNIAVAEWSPEYKAVVDAVLPLLVAYADDMERLGRDSGNPVWEDFAVLAAQYVRAYIEAAPTFSPNYADMTLTATAVANAINWACKAQS